MGKPPAEDPMVAKAFDKDSHDELARAVDNLTSEEAAFFLAKLEAAFKKRKIQLSGYLVAMLLWILAMMGALAYYGTHKGFVGWVFILPFGLVGVILFAFGKWAERVGARAPASPVETKRAPAP
ncbi:MAG: hypothetical protein H0T46_34775 [Deltaproteobacteria bacterium]|nr:hypothetical protein [Deltaproteobacteria bacterium]